MTPTLIDTDNPEFQNALKLIQYTRQSVFLTGKAGTGKSTISEIRLPAYQKEICGTGSYGHCRYQCGWQYPAQFFQTSVSSAPAR